LPTDEIRLPFFYICRFQIKETRRREEGKKTVYIINRIRLTVGRLLFLRLYYFGPAVKLCRTRQNRKNVRLKLNKPIFLNRLDTIYNAYIIILSHFMPDSNIMCSNAEIGLISNNKNNK